MKKSVPYHANLHCKASHWKGRLSHSLYFYLTNGEFPQWMAGYVYKIFMSWRTLSNQLDGQISWIPILGHPWLHDPKRLYCLPWWVRKVGSNPRRVVFHAWIFSNFHVSKTSWWWLKFTFQSGSESTISCRASRIGGATILDYRTHATLTQ